MDLIITAVRISGVSVLFLTVTAASWVALNAIAFTRGSRLLLCASSALPPSLAAWSVLSWTGAYFADALSREQESSTYLAFWRGDVWRLPARSLLERAGLPHGHSPWLDGRGGSPWLFEFPSDDTFAYFLLGLLNDSAVLVWCGTIGAVVSVLVLERVRRA